MSEAEESEITAVIKRIEALLAARSTPQDVGQAIEDVFETYGQISMIREVLGHLVTAIRDHDVQSRARAAAITTALTEEKDATARTIELNANSNAGRWRDVERDLRLLSARIHALEDAFLDDGQIGAIVTAVHRLAIDVEELKARRVGGDGE